MQKALTSSLGSPFFNRKRRPSIRMVSSVVMTWRITSVVVGILLMISTRQTSSSSSEMKTDDGPKVLRAARQIRVLSSDDGERGPAARRSRVFATFSVVFDRELACEGVSLASAKRFNKTFLFESSSRLVCDHRVFEARVADAATSTVHSKRGYLMILFDEELRKCAGALDHDDVAPSSYNVALVLDANLGRRTRRLHDVPSWLDSCYLTFRGPSRCNGRQWPRNEIVIFDDKSLDQRHALCLHHVSYLEPLLRRGSSRDHDRSDDVALTNDEWNELLRRMHAGANVMIESFAKIRDEDDELTRFLGQNSGERRDSSFRHRRSLLSVDEEEEEEKDVHADTTTPPFKLTKVDNAVLTLVEVSGRLRDMIRTGHQMREGTIFEVIINPMINAFSAMMPQVVYWVTKEILVALIEWILEQMVFPVFTEPALAKLVPSRGGAFPLTRKDKTCSKDRSIKCATDEECDDKAPCNSGKTCTCARDVECNADSECGDKAPCNSGKTCVGNRAKSCDADADCGDGEGPCDSGKTCSKDRSRTCTYDEDCAKDGHGVCNSGKTCTGDRTRECSIDAECACDGKGVCDAGGSKKGACAKDRSIPCETNAECGDKAPCEKGWTCSKDRSIECATDEECDDKAPCNSGKTCTCARDVECNADSECGDKAPCNSGKTCVGNRAKSCDADADCGDGEGPCDSGKTCSKDRSRTCTYDEDCAKDGHGVCNSGKTCTGDRTRECSIDAECACDGKGVCDAGGSKKGACAKDRSIPCETNAECGDKAPCEKGWTCSKDRSIECATDEECDDKAPCNSGKTCTCARDVECNADSECGDKAPCNSGKTCVGNRAKSCDADADCGDGEGPCDSGKTCSKDRSRTCTYDEDCAKDGHGVCNSGKTCTGDRTRECSIDAECACDGKGVCDAGGSKKGACAKDRSIPCETNAECGDKAPCEKGWTCSKDRSIECATDEECDDKAPCNSGKTCTCARDVECNADSECGDKAPCNSGKTCVGNRAKSCDADADCGDGEGPCDSGKTCSKDRSRTCTYDEDCAKDGHGVCNSGKTCTGDRTRECSIDAECACDGKGVCDSGIEENVGITRQRDRGRTIVIFPHNATVIGGVVPAEEAFGHGDVGGDGSSVSKVGFVGVLNCEDDCGEIPHPSKSDELGPPQPDVDLPHANSFIELEFAGEVASPPGGLAEKLTLAITDGVIDDLSSAVRRRFDEILGPKIRKAVVRSAARSVTRKLTTELGHSLSRVLVELTTLSVTAVSTRSIVQSLVPSLTASLVPIITRSLTRDPKSDYYCRYCLEHRVYCDVCRQSMETERRIGIASVLTTAVTTPIITPRSFYGSTGADASSKEYFSRGRRAGGAA